MENEKQVRISIYRGQGGFTIIADDVEENEFSKSGGHRICGGKHYGKTLIAENLYLNIPVENMVDVDED